MASPSLPLHGCHQVTISDDGVRAFAASLDVEKLGAAAGASLALPLHFDGIEAAVNFWVALNVVNFGSGFRHDLHSIQERGAYESQVRGSQDFAGWKGAVKPLGGPWGLVAFALGGVVGSTPFPDLLVC